MRDLSPLSAFLGRWGLGAEDEDELIDQIVATVRENLRRDLRRQGANTEFDVRIRNSRDHQDRFGRNNWSRAIVGGTIDESGIPTIGIAQSIDPGNYGREETALVLLDILSDPPAGFGDPSLNSYITPGVRCDRVRGPGAGATSSPTRLATTSATGTSTSSTRSRTRAATSPCCTGGTRRHRRDR